MDGWGYGRVDAFCVWEEGERLNEAPVGAILVIALPCSSAGVRDVLGEEGADFFFVAVILWIILYPLSNRAMEKIQDELTARRKAEWS